jgi:hypothetical protein
VDADGGEQAAAAEQAADLGLELAETVRAAARRLARDVVPAVVFRMAEPPPR